MTTADEILNRHGLGLPEGEQHRGQARIAYRLAATYGDRLMHVHGLGWLRYDGARWTEDHGGAAKRAVLDVLRSALAESLHDRDLRTDVRKCESAAGVSGVLDLAAALHPFAAEVADLDADPYLLNCANGTLDLRTRTLRPHDPADRLTKGTTGAYDPHADAGVWEAFLSQVLPDEAERAYLQRVLGQAVYGRVREHLFPILIGSGSNGKSTAYGAVTNALGSYAVVIDPSLLMARERGGAGGPELMQLLGARLVVGSETEEGRKLDQAVMKRLCGGDELTARRLYSPPVSWRPSHQLVFVSNRLPVVRGDDPAVWRRIRVMPFDVVVPAAERNPRLAETLMLHADAVLTWVIAGHFDYEDNGGMREPASVLRATGDYQVDSDVVARFVADENVVCAGHGTAGSADLYRAFVAWCRNEGEPTEATNKSFTDALEKRGFERKKTSRGTDWKGLSLVPDD